MTSLRATLTVVGRRLEPEHHRLRDFLTRIAQPFEWVEAGTEEADRVLGERGLAEADLPVVVGSELQPQRVKLKLEGGYDVEARVVVAAPGMVWRRLDVDGVEDLLERGVRYGAGRWRPPHRACSWPGTRATGRRSAWPGRWGEGAMAAALVHRRLDELSGLSL